MLLPIDASLIFRASAQAGSVLEESARIALSWIRAHSAELGLPASDESASDGGAEGRQSSRAATDPSCWDVHGMLSHDFVAA